MLEASKYPNFDEYRSRRNRANVECAIVGALPEVSSVLLELRILWVSARTRDERRTTPSPHLMQRATLTPLSLRHDVFDIVDCDRNAAQLWYAVIPTWTENIASRS